MSGSMNTSEGCSTVSDISGNLLFYTDGSTIWNQNHAVMPNGSNLGGNSSTTQSSNIVKQPGNSNIYYVFSLSVGATSTLYYSIVDMSLSAGLGSVTVNNVQISSLNTEKLTSLRHCNATDYWVLCVPSNSPVLNAYLLTAAGLNTVAVVSTLLGFNPSWYGNMKTSPDGRKIAFGNATYGSFAVCDFDISTGIASNLINLVSGFPAAYGVEFSPDGTKLYGTSWGGSYLNQWNMCAGSSQSIINSLITMSLSNSVAGMQLGIDGKIYVAKPNQTSLAIINNPNNLGAACNYTGTSSFTLTGACRVNLPNFITSDFSPPPGYTYTLGGLNSCNSMSFNAAASQNYQANICSVTVSPGPTGVLWNFGDPLSGNANTSTLTAPNHTFTNPGTYTVSLIVYNSNFCTGDNDTIRKIIAIPFCVSVSSQSITCASLGSATVTPLNGMGPFNYTWMPTGQTSSVASGLNPGTHTLQAFDMGTSLVYTTTTTFVPLVPYTGTVTNSAYQPCAAVNTGTASVALSGGSGNQNYNWTGPTGTQTNALATGLSMGVYTVTVVDALTSCALTQTFSLSGPPPPVGVYIMASTNSVCFGESVTFTAQAYGGNPAFTYSWSSGPATNTFTAAPSVAGSYNYTATAKDANNCTITAVASASFIPLPPLSLSSVSICPQQVGTLTVSGANSYTWSTGVNTATLTDNPLSTTAYSVVGTASGCTSIATASILLKSVPDPTISSNGPVCSNKILDLYGSGGINYLWAGPAGFMSLLQNPQINPVNINNGGVYNVTVTAANSCTASSSISVTVNATPVLSATGATVCNTQTINLSAIAPAAISFSWTGPNTFTSSLQNLTIVNPPVSASGIYSINVASANGCTNSALANVTVSAMPFLEFTNDGPKCQGLTLSFNSSTSVGGDSYTWVGPNGFNTSVPNPFIPNVSPAAAGIYTLTLITGPCAISATQAAIIYPTPLPVIQNNSPVCEGKSINLSVTASYPVYQWIGPLNYTSITQGFAISNSDNLQGGQYQVVVTDTNSCMGTAITTVNVIPNPILFTTSAEVCYGSPAVISASGAATYFWSGPNGFSATTAQATIPLANNIMPVVYYVLGTGLNTCTTLATAEVNTLPLPVAQASLTARACVNGVVHFSATGGVFYVWQGPLNFSASLQNFSVTVTNPGMAGVYTLVATDENGCKGSATASLIVDRAPQGGLWSSHPQRCVPFCSDFKLASTTSIASASWEINGQTFMTDSFNYCFTSPGDYSLNGSFTDYNGCKSTIPFIIRTYPLPMADFTYQPEHPIENEEIQFTSTSASPDLKNWSWYFGTNMEYRNGYSAASHLFPDAGVYPVELVIKNKWGCEDTVVKAITVSEDFYLFVPNAFTPSGDELNETFRAVGRGVKIFSMLVYDRWGEKLFEGNDLSIGWDGSFNGKVCKSDVYIWKIHATSFDGKEKNMTGSVLLYR